MICWDVNPFCSIAPDGHAATQHPHPLQRPALTLLFFFPSTSMIEIALYSQHPSQTPHPSQYVSLTEAMIPSETRYGFEMIVSALEAAPDACARHSSMNLGQCARPATKTPSVAKST